MLTAQLKQNFLNDITFSGWTDTLNIATSRQPKNSYNRIVGEYKAPNTSKKIQVVLSNGANIRFMEGNQIISEYFWATALKDNQFEKAPDGKYISPIAPQIRLKTKKAK